MRLFTVMNNQNLKWVLGYIWVSNIIFDESTFLKKILNSSVYYKSYVEY